MPSPTAPARYVVPFAELGLADLPRVGGKGANLGEMCRAGFPVPPGFCVQTEAWRTFLAEAPPDALAPLDGLAHPVDLAEVRVAGAAIRERLGAVPIPAAIADEVRAAWAALGEAHPYAVRSSATAEDLPDASFAGQQDTYLNLRGADAVLDGVRRCWISLFTDRAILYRAQHGFAHADVALAVVVQRQILPDAAGILFTADPITSSRAIVAIDAGFGLGEGLVSGRVSADLYHVDKATGKLVHQGIADKVLAIRPRPDGGTEEVPLSDADRRRPVLTPADAEALAALGARIEAHYGRPQDIEWCIEGGDTFVVQSRPITTLHPLPEPPPDPASVARGPHVYVSWNHVQAMTDPMPDLARSLIQLAHPLGKGGEPRMYGRYMASAGGRLFHDATELLRIGFLARRLPRMLEQSDPLIGRALADVVARPGFRAGGRARDTLRVLLGLAALAIPHALRTLGHLALGTPEAKVPAASDRLEATLAAWRARLSAAPPGAERVAVARAMVVAILPDIDHTLPLIFASFAAAALLRRRSPPTPGDDPVGRLVRASPHNVLTEKDERLAAIAELARADDDLAGLIRHPPEGDAAAFIAACGRWPEARDALAAWFERFGDRGPGEVDVSRPRYRDDPRPIWNALASTLDGPPDAFAHQQAAMADAAADAARALGSERRLVRLARHLFAARELPKFYWLRVLGLARRVFLDEGALLLDKPDDVWFLTIDELLALASGDRTLVDRIADRKAAHRRAAALEPARVLTSDGEVVVARHEAGAAPEGALVGVSASPGVAEGVARIVHDPGVESLAPGEILVAAYTDPGWTPLFPLAAGLVMEVGGQMTHGSVVAREYGIPAVVCVPGATRQLRDGERVRVDGDHGWVVPLDRAAPGGDRGSGTSAATSAAVDAIAAAAPALHAPNPTDA